MKKRKFKNNSNSSTNFLSYVIGSVGLIIIGIVLFFILRDKSKKYA